MKSIIKAITLSCFLFIITACHSEDDVQSPSQEIDEYQGTDWTLNNLDGKSITLSDYKGRPTLLVFWATWCPYCKKLLPGIAELNEKYEKLGLKVLAVNIREDWKPEVYWKNTNNEVDYDDVSILAKKTVNLMEEEKVPKYG